MGALWMEIHSQAGLARSHRVFFIRRCGAAAGPDIIPWSGPGRSRFRSRYCLACPVLIFSFLPLSPHIISPLPLPLFLSPQHFYGESFKPHTHSSLSSGQWLNCKWCLQFSVLKTNSHCHLLILRNAIFILGNWWTAEARLTTTNCLSTLPNLSATTMYILQGKPSLKKCAIFRCPITQSLSLLVKLSWWGISFEKGFHIFIVPRYPWRHLVAKVGIYSSDATFKLISVRKMISKSLQ